MNVYPVKFSGYGHENTWINLHSFGGNECHGFACNGRQYFWGDGTIFTMDQTIFEHMFDYGQVGIPYRIGDLYRPLPTLSDLRSTGTTDKLYVTCQVDCSASM